MSREGDTLDASQAQRHGVASELPELPVLDEQRFRLGDEKARGGIGRIVEATDQFLGRRIAVKQLIAATSDDDRTRFLREAMLTARLSHPAIVPIYDAGVRPSGEPYYAMPFVAGGTLLQALGASSGLDGRLALLPHVQAVADAMAYAHEQHIVHRDLKPANVLVGAFGETVLIDWGLAKDTRTGESPAGRSGFAPLVEHVSATRTGDVIGTPAYMSPEQARGELVDEKSDVYALGAMLYYLCAGHAPHGDVRGPLAGPPAPLPGNVPAPLAAICRKAMQGDPAARYPSARELAVELRRFQTGQLVAAHVYGRRERLARFVRRNKAALAVGSVSLGLLAAFATFSFLRITEERNAARAAEHEAAARRDLVTLAQARSVLDHDPTASLAWLRSLPDSAAGGEDAQAVAALADSRGVARHVISGDGTPIQRVSMSPREADEMAVLGGAGRAMRVLQPSTGRELARLDAGVELAGMMYSPDGTRLAAAGRDGRVYLWEVPGFAPSSFVVVDRPLTMLAWSRDGEKLAAGANDGLIRVFARDARPLVDLRGHERNISALAFSPDGTRLASGSGDKTARLWDLASGTGRVVSQHKSPVAVGINTSGKVMYAAAVADRSVTLTELPDGPTRTAPLPATAWQLVFSPDGERLAWGGDDRTVHMLELAGEPWELTGQGHRDEVARLAWAPDGEHLASVDMDRTVRLWDLKGFRSVGFRGHTRDVYGAFFSKDGRLLVSWADDGMLRVWHTDRFAAAFSEGWRWLIPDVAWAPDGSRLAYVAEDGNLFQWKPGDPEPKPVRVHRGAIETVVWSADARHIFTIGADGVLRRLTAADGQHEVVAENLDELVASPDGKVLVAAATGKQGRVLRLAGGTPETLVDGGPPLVAVAVSADGATVVWGGGGRLWRWRAGASQELPAQPGELVELALSPDGETLALALVDGRVLLRAGGGAAQSLPLIDLGSRPAGLRYSGAHLLAWSTGGMISVSGPVHRRLIRVLSGSALDVELSPDGRLLAAACDDTTTRVWDLVSGGHRVLVGDRFSTIAVAFAADGRLASVGEDVSVFARPGDDLVPRGAEALRAWIDAHTSAVLDVARPERPLASPSGSPDI